VTSPTEQESRSLHWSLISGDWGAPERLTAGPSSKQQRRLLTAYQAEANGLACPIDGAA
jgi:hypothetical protein